MKKLTYLTVSSFVPVKSWKASAKSALLLMLLSTLLFTACGNEKKQIDTLYKATETIHEEAMKGLADMNRVTRALKDTMISAQLTPEQSMTYNEVLSQMGLAENNMLDWMKGYKTTDNMAPADAIKYLQEQKMILEKSQAEIEAALEAGKKLQGK